MLLISKNFIKYLTHLKLYCYNHFTIKNIYYSASSSIITPNLSKLAAGFCTAEIRLWGIGDTVLTRSRFRNPTNTLTDSDINVEDEINDET